MDDSLSTVLFTAIEEYFEETNQENLNYDDLWFKIQWLLPEAKPSVENSCGPRCRKTTLSNYCNCQGWCI
jgi:hypothetical protein